MNMNEQINNVSIQYKAFPEKCNLRANFLYIENEMLFCLLFLTFRTILSKEEALFCGAS